MSCYVAANKNMDNRRFLHDKLAKIERVKQRKKIGETRKAPHNTNVTCFEKNLICKAETRHTNKSN